MANAGGANANGASVSEPLMRLGHFQGTEDPADVKAFVRKVESLKKAAAWNDERTAGAVTTAFKGKAAKWIEVLEREDNNDINSWDTLKPLFEKRWIRDLGPSDRAALQEALKQTSEQTVRDFADHCKFMVFRAYEHLPENVRTSDAHKETAKDQVLTKFLFGLLPSINETVNHARPRTLEEALAAAENAEMTVKAKKGVDKKTLGHVAEVRGADDGSAATADEEDQEDEHLEGIIEAIRAGFGRGNGRGGSSNGRPNGRGGGNGNRGKGGKGKGQWNGWQANSGNGGNGNQNSGGWQVANAGRGRGRGRGTCWTCGGPHYKRDCPSWREFQHWQGSRGAQSGSSPYPSNANGSVKAIDYQPESASSSGQGAPPPRQEGTQYLFQ